MNDFGIIWMKFGNEVWLILFREYISPKLFAVHCADVRSPYQQNAELTSVLRFVSIITLRLQDGNVSTSQSNELARGPPELKQPFRLWGGGGGGSHGHNSGA
jgi:hypothetical protein